MTKQERVFAIQTLHRVIARFEDMSFNNSGKGLTYRQWFYEVEDALTIVRKALEAVTKTKPSEKLPKGFRVVNTAFGEVVVVDMARLERDAIVEQIADKDVQKLLPFQTSRVMGETHIHIQNDSAYVVETNSHLIREGGTLCAKSGQTYRFTAGMAVSCPGCLIKGKNLIAEYIIKNDLLG